MIEDDSLCFIVQKFWCDSIWSIVTLDYSTAKTFLYRSLLGKPPWALLLKLQFFELMGAYVMYWALTMCTNGN